MKDLITNPLFQRVFLTVLSCAAFVAAALLPSVRSELMTAGGLLFGWARLNKPGYISEELVSSVAAKTAASVHPPPRMFPSDIPVAGDIRNNITPVEGKRK